LPEDECNPCEKLSLDAEQEVIKNKRIMIYFTILRDMHIFMNLEGDSPFRILLNVFNNFRYDLIKPAPFRLKK
jgi:hypothetical protein